MKRCAVQDKVKLRNAGEAARFLKPGEQFRLYRCPHCGFFHMTTTPRHGRKETAA